MSNLQKLIDSIGQDEVNAIFTEYFMITLSKALKCDKIAKALEDEKCTIEQVRSIFYDEYTE